MCKACSFCSFYLICLHSIALYVQMSVLLKRKAILNANKFVINVNSLRIENLYFADKYG